MKDDCDSENNVIETETQSKFYLNDTGILSIVSSVAICTPLFVGGNAYPYISDLYLNRSKMAVGYGCVTITLASIVVGLVVSNCYAKSKGK